MKNDARRHSKYDILLSGNRRRIRTPGRWRRSTWPSAAAEIKAGIDSTPGRLTEDEAAFYDALAKPDAVRKCFTDETLIAMTKELTDQLRRNRTVDWDRRIDARSKMKMMIKRLLKKYRYPPKEADGALETVMRQCELWVDSTSL